MHCDPGPSPELRPLPSPCLSPSLWWTPVGVVHSDPYLLGLNPVAYPVYSSQCAGGICIPSGTSLHGVNSQALGLLSGRELRAGSSPHPFPNEERTWLQYEASTEAEMGWMP